MKIVTVIPLKKGTPQGQLTYFTNKNVENGDIVTIPLRNKNILGLVAGVESAEGVKSDIKDMSFNLRKIAEVKEHSIFRKEYFDSIFELSQYFATSKDNSIASLIPVILREEYDTLLKFYSKTTFAKNSDEITAPQKSIKAEKLLFQSTFEDRISSYKTLIREAFALKKSVYMVLPTERDIHNWYDILSKGIEQFTFTIHGGVSKNKTLEKIEDIMTTEHGILILGTAPFLSIPRNDVGIIIVEHESSNSYKMIPRPHLDLRIFSELFASKIGAKLILSDTILRFETIARNEVDGIAPIHPLSYRINFDGVIEIINPQKNLESSIRDIKEEDATITKFKIFSDQTIQEIKENISKKKNVFIFSLRKGMATMTVCRDCGDVVTCDRCSSPLVLYLSKENQDGEKRMFACNRCQREIDGDVKCKNCGSWNLMPLGIGTDTVVEELKEVLSRDPELPKVKIFKLDKEIAKTAKGAEEIVSEFEDNNGAILVGTEMALFYLNAKVPFSIIASFDSLWSIPNFRMSEKIIQLIISVLGNTGERFIVQTKNENDGAIQGIKNKNLLSFVREEIGDRKKLGYPPFKRFIKITHLGDKTEATNAREILREIFNDYEPEIFSGFVAKLKGKYITNALIKVDPKMWSLSSISINSKIDQELLLKLRLLPRNFEVSVDPEDLL